MDALWRTHVFVHYFARLGTLYIVHVSEGMILRYQRFDELNLSEMIREMDVPEQIASWIGSYIHPAIAPGPQFRWVVFHVAVTGVGEQEERVMVSVISRYLVQRALPAGFLNGRSVFFNSRLSIPSPAQPICYLLVRVSEENGRGVCRLQLVRPGSRVIVEMDPSKHAHTYLFYYRMDACPYYEFSDDLPEQEKPAASMGPYRGALPRHDGSMPMIVHDAFCASCEAFSLYPEGATNTTMSLAEQLSRMEDMASYFTDDHLYLKVMRITLPSREGDAFVAEAAPSGPHISLSRAWGLLRQGNLQLRPIVSSFR